MLFPTRQLATARYLLSSHYFTHSADNTWGIRGWHDMINRKFGWVLSVQLFSFFFPWDIKIALMQGTRTYSFFPPPPLMNAFFIFFFVVVVRWCLLLPWSHSVPWWIFQLRQEWQIALHICVDTANNGDGSGERSLSGSAFDSAKWGMRVSENGIETL